MQQTDAQHRPNTNLADGDICLTTAPGPVPTAERAIAPDLARGSMLLFIGLANSSGLAVGTAAANATVQALEHTVNLLLFTFIHARAYPVFAIMFGYSLVQLARRQEAAGASRAEVRSLLLRRNGWLIVFGLFHAALLYFGDFLAAYGIIGILTTLFVLHRERVQRVVLWLWGLSLLELAGLTGFLIYHWINATGEPAAAAPEIPPVGSAATTDYLSSIFLRLSEWPMHTATVLPAIFIVCLGIWAARRRMLEDLEQHRGLLRKVAFVSLAIAFIGAVPLALCKAELLHAGEQTFFVIDLLHKISGMFGGPGYVALIGLITLRLRDTSGWTGRIIALGRRSLSGYLFQSAAWLLLFAPYTLHLGARFGAPITTAAILAALVWLISVYAAEHMEKRAYRGPAETLLRRLTYRTSTHSSRARAPAA